MTSAPATLGEELLGVEHLTQRFRVKGGTLEAVSDVSFSIARGETLGMVGESGSGKTSVARAVLQLPPPTSGSVRFDGRELTTMSRGDFVRQRQRMSLIFQDPVASLNARRRIRDIVAEGLVIAKKDDRLMESRVDEMLELVGLKPHEVRNRRPHQLSGGQCQRVAIARALILGPELLVCDEPVASLDVSVQGQVLNLLEDMRRRFGLSMLLISHDLAVVHNVSDRIAVMYLGKIVEVASAGAISKRPAHPYTRALLDAVPVADPERRGKAHPTLKGEIPSPMSPPSGCRFRTRCPLAQLRCAEEVPALRPLADGQLVACHFPLVGEPAANAVGALR